MKRTEAQIRVQEAVQTVDQHFEEVSPFKTPEQFFIAATDLTQSIAEKLATIPLEQLRLLSLSGKRNVALDRRRIQAVDQPKEGELNAVHTHAVLALNGDVRLTLTPANGNDRLIFDYSKRGGNEQIVVHTAPYISPPGYIETDGTYAFELENGSLTRTAAVRIQYPPSRDGFIGAYLNERIIRPSTRRGKHKPIQLTRANVPH